MLRMEGSYFNQGSGVKRFVFELEPFGSNVENTLEGGKDGKGNQLEGHCSSSWEK